MNHILAVHNGLRFEMMLSNGPFDAAFGFPVVIYEDGQLRASAQRHDTIGTRPGVQI
jgi:hypothetical protein